MESRRKTNGDSATAGNDMTSARGETAMWTAWGNALDAQRRETPQLLRSPKGDPLPLSSAQQRVWFIQQADQTNVAYNLAFSWKLTGPLNREALGRSFQEIIKRHDVFRTVIATVNGHAQQIIAPFFPAELPFVDLEGISEEECQKQIAQQCGEVAREPFDLANGPLLRLLLIRTRAQEHVLCLVVHHIIFDGTSLGILYRELKQLYAAFLENKKVALPELPLRYADFANWEQQTIRGKTFDKQLSFWKEKLNGKLPVLNLPTDRPRPPVQSFRGALHHFQISREIVGLLNEFRQQENASLFVITLSAFKALLFRYTGQEDILVGSLASNRHRSELRNLIGFFVNTQIFRTGIDDRTTFRELVAQVSEFAVDAIAHSDVPFDKLVEALKPERDASHTAFFQTLYSFHSLPRKALELPGLKVQQMPIDTGSAKFDLSLDVNEMQDGLACSFEYNTDLFDRETITRLAFHFRILLELAVKDPTRPIAELMIISDAERHQISAWNNTSREYPRDACLHTLIERQVRRTPDRVALEFNGREMTYADLDAKADLLATFLRSLGVGDEAMVGLCIERSFEMVIAMLAILKAGGSYVPLDPAFPVDRLGFMIEDSRMSLLLTRERFKQLLPTGSAKVICLDAGIENVAKSKTSSAQLPKTEPQNRAYTLYTSGSTGRPKGVEIVHSAVVNFLLSMQRLPGLAETDSLLAITTLSFDIAGLEIFLPLITGAKVVLVSREVAGDATLLTEAIQKSNITVMQATPATWRLLVQAGWRGAPGLKILCGGEALTEELANALLPRCAELWNLYGPTETTIWSSAIRVLPGKPIVLGPPIANTQIYLLDRHLRHVPIGVPGELCIGGDGLARGYLNRPELTEEKFLNDPFSSNPAARLYRTGDLARFRGNGTVEFLGRIDHQVKIRGYRIELGEIESVLAQHPEVENNVVISREDVPGEKRLVAYIIPRGKSSSTEELRRFLLERLPEYMVPSAFVHLATFPLTPNAKVDRKALPAPDASRPELQARYVPARNKTEQIISTIWQEVLNVEKVGVHDSFFELGGYSLLLVKVHAQLARAFPKPILMAEMFRYPTVESLAGFFSQPAKADPVGIRELSPLSRRKSKESKSPLRNSVAIVGLAGRFPGAKNIAEFWRNLRDGVESISQLTEEELLANGVSADDLNNPLYVRAGADLEGLDQFDAGFFGINPKEAEILDPQQRLFLETAWEALEHAGYNPDAFSGRIGVFAGASMNTYVFNLIDHSNANTLAEAYQVFIGNDKDFLPTRVSYKLNLRGPSFNVQTACSTSLAAVHLACQSLLVDECEMVLAGGVCGNLSRGTGYVYQPGMILSNDGHCRPFDARAQGTVGGMGVGVVVLKRLSDALEDGDTIHAVIRGTAVNNDGGEKLGYTTPSVSGQAEVVMMAQAAAGVDPTTIGFVEAHGTGTPLGDPIEVAGLTAAFRRATDKKQFCALGSVKSNVGHLDVAAGVTALIKTVLCLKHRAIPPTLHFQVPNDKLELSSSPFYVNSHLLEWKVDDGTPRRAGVSAFGIGGTNAHAVIEEAPPSKGSGQSRPYQLLILSGRSESAAYAACANLASYLRESSPANLADVAYTLQIGRKAFEQRCFSVCSSLSEAIHAFESPDKMTVSGEMPRERKVVFLFTGQGAQHFRMGFDLYKNEMVFREAVDQCAEILKSSMKMDLRDLLFQADAGEELAMQINATAFAQPALFTVEYALAKLWGSWGIEPEAMMGHSIGEYVAACLAGVFSLEDALHLVAERGRLMQELPGGAMLAVPLSEEEVQPFLTSDIALAANNAPCLNIVSGPDRAIQKLSDELTVKGLNCKRLQTSHAFHSHMMEPMLTAFGERLSRLVLSAPTKQFISNLTGTWISAGEATDPTYWLKHLRHAVQFSKGMIELLKDHDRVFLEIGPGLTLAGLTKMHAVKEGAIHALSSLPRANENISAQKHLLISLGHLWSLGVCPDWKKFYADEHRLRVPLPTYAFERQRYWIDKPRRVSVANPDEMRRLAFEEWFSLPSWKRANVDKSTVQQTSRERIVWLIFADRCGLGENLARQLKQIGQIVTLVTQGKEFRKTAENNFVFNPYEESHYERLFEALMPMGRIPSRIIHLWTVTSLKDHFGSTAEKDERLLDLSFYSLLSLGQALRRHTAGTCVHLKVISNHLHEVTGGEELFAEKAVVLGPCRVIAQENKDVRCSSIDVVLPSPRETEQFNELLLDELFSETSEPVVAHRAGFRWVQTFESVRLCQKTKDIMAESGVYLITGGLGGIGLTLAGHLSNRRKCTLILTGRTQIPGKIERSAWIAAHGENDSISLKIRKIEELERQGAEVVVLNVDVADDAKMTDALQAVEKRLGRINGIVHAAGVPGGGVIDLKTREGSEDVLLPKVHGTLVLHRYFAKRPLEFFVLCSSVNALLGGVGQVDYAAANAFLDAYAHQYRHRNVFSINWYAWQEVGMAVNTQVPQELQAERGKVLRMAIRPMEGVEAFSRILENRLPQVIVSPENFSAFLRREGVGIGKAEEDSGKSAHKYSRPKTATQYVAPCTDLERELSKMWEDVLAIEKVGVRDDFFQLGGHSLLALNLLGKIKKATGQELPLSILFQGPTIEKLAELLGDQRQLDSDGASKRSQIIVPIKPSGSKSPFFCVHGVGGAVLEYSHLARHLDADRPLYGIQAQGLDGKEHWLKTVDEMAERYLEEIKSIQPKGPYYIGGSSFGGLVAFEMARRLQATGEKVALLAFFDSYGRDYPAPLPVKNRFQAKARRELARLDLHLTNLRALKPAEWPGYLAEKVSRIPLRVKRAAKKAKQDFRFLFLPRALRNQFRWTGNDGGDMWHFKLPKAYSQVADLNLKSCVGYHFKPYSGSAVLFRATKQPHGIHEDLTNGWNALIEGGLIVIDVPGYHGAIIREPLVRDLAAKLNQALGAVDSK